MTLSSTESKYTKLKWHNIDMNYNLLVIKYKVFENNSRILEIVTLYKYYLYTKYLNIKLYHFCNYVTRGNIIIKPIDKKNWLADYLTKPANETILVYLKKKVIYW